ncbi:hypothetical protein D3C80_1065790 [compost metagenome]
MYSGTTAAALALEVVRSKLFWMSIASRDMCPYPADSDSEGQNEALASPTRSKAAATRRCAAIMSGLRSSASRGMPAGMPGGKGESSARGVIAAAG